MKTNTSSEANNDADNNKTVRKVNNDFFSIGIPSARGGNHPQLDIVDAEENRDDAWRNIKPSQNVDALNKEVFKKRKYEEFRARCQTSNNRNHRNNKSYKSQYYSAKRPKITPEMEEKQRI